MSDLLPGTEVVARGLRWQVVLSEHLGEQVLIRLRGLEGAVLGQELDLLSPFETVHPIIHNLDPERAAPLRNWLVYHQAFILEQALGPGALLASQPGRLRLEPYQLVPVLRAIRMGRPRLLLADAVGLGKTVQAGLILTELMARRLAHRVLVVSPAGPLLEQWRTELAERFGLRLRHIDRAALEDIRRGTELGANPFDHVALGISSMDFLKQDRLLELLEKTTYDVVVVDEAHHCMDLGAAEEREDSQRRKLAQVLARRCDALILATATPHDGNDRSFASLCELLDPSLVDGRGALRGSAYRAHVVRRLKKHIRDPVTGEPRFRERQVVPIPVVPSPTAHAPFIELHRALLDLVAPELRRAFRSRRYSEVLSYIALLKRSVSTVCALRSTLQVVADRLRTLATTTAEGQDSRRQRLRTLQQAHRRLERLGSASEEEQEDLRRLEAEDLAQQLADMQREVRRGSFSLKRAADVVAALDDLVALADRALPLDPKLAQLVAEIRSIRAAEPGVNVLVYTEYTDTLEVAAEALDRAGLGPVLTMRGDHGEAERMATTERFRSQDRLVLVSTDAAAEGLNLHQRCHHLIHLELPFNPNRLEQRNGRIDRYGQEQDPIVRYLYLSGSFEERILLRLIAKYERQRARLTFVPNTLGSVTATDGGTERLLKGLLDEDTRAFTTQPLLFDLARDEAEGADPATRELLEEIDRSLHGFERAARSHAWLGDAGLNADDAVLREAAEAHTSSTRTAPVDLADFVCDAVLLDGGDVSGAPNGPVFALQLPTGWGHDLAELPGYDASSRRILLTTRIEVTADAAGCPVGFLGRAHPLVRRAVDRVCHLALGSSSQAGQDPRVSAVTSPDGPLRLLYTFLARVTSKAGRQLERVVAVEVFPAGDAIFRADAADWAALVDPSRAIPTAGLWQRYFASWAASSANRAKAAAAAGFAPVAQGFAEEHQQQIAVERSSLEAWLLERAVALGGDEVPPAVQVDLFGRSAPPVQASLPVSAVTDPEGRLVAVATDRSQAPSRRSEADGVLRLFRQRSADLDARAALAPPEVVSLGLLLIVAEVGRGA